MVALLCAALLCASAFPPPPAFAYAEEPVIIGETIGYVTQVHGDVLHVVGEPLTNSGFESVRVRIGDAPVYDLRTGFKASRHVITKNTNLRIAYIVPPQADTAAPLEAVVLWLNWNEADAAVFTVIASENFRNDTEGTVFLCSDGKYCISLAPDTEILDSRGNRLSHANITQGMEFFIWVDMITASSPALVFPHKVVQVE